VQNESKDKHINFRVLEQKRLAEELIVEIDHGLAGLPHNTKTAVIRDQFFRLLYFINGLDIVSFAPIVAADSDGYGKQKGVRGKQK
jgi:hypothetical protein